MCGRYFIDDETYGEIRYMLELESAGLISPGDIYPTNYAPVITSRGAAAVKWGFPKWKGAGVIINARAETAADKSMFKNPLKSRRCLIPSSGFYEWSRKNGDKEKYSLKLPDGQVLYMAGIIGLFPGSGGEYEAFAILTTAACGSVSAIHDRMPVILSPDERDLWLNDTAFAMNALKRPGPELMIGGAYNEGERGFDSVSYAGDHTCQDENYCGAAAQVAQQPD